MLENLVAAVLLLAAIAGGLAFLAANLVRKHELSPQAYRAQLSPEAKELLASIETIYRHLGPTVPDSVGETNASYEWAKALDETKRSMGRYGSAAFYPGDAADKPARKTSIAENEEA